MLTIHARRNVSSLINETARWADRDYDADWVPGDLVRRQMFEYDIDHHIHIPLGIVLWVNKTNDETDVGIFWSDLPGSA